MQTASTLALLLAALLVATSIAQDIPDFYDTRVAYPACAPQVLNQGSCGSCWAFSATTSLSDRFCIASHADIATYLSPQYLANCDTGNAGCGGGDTYKAYQFISHNGNDNLNCTKYYSGGTGKTGDCPKTCDDGKTAISKGILFFASQANNLNTGDVKQNVIAMQRDLLANGPISASFLVKQEFLDFFKKNATGIYQTTYGGRILGGHAVKIIGWGSDNGVNYWQLVNSWGTSWGDMGFFKMIRGMDDSNIETRKITSGVPLISREPIAIQQDQQQESTVDGAFTSQTCDDEMVTIASLAMERVNAMNMMKNEAPKNLNNIVSCATQVANGINYKFAAQVTSALEQDAVAQELQITVHVDHENRITVTKME